MSSLSLNVKLVYNLSLWNIGVGLFIGPSSAFLKT